MPGWVSDALRWWRRFPDGTNAFPSQRLPVESTSTECMLSRLGRTVEMALKPTERERQLLRARLAVQRFPVVEWRQRTEDFHSRSIGTSRSIAGHKSLEED